MNEFRIKNWEKAFLFQAWEEEGRKKIFIRKKTFDKNTEEFSANN
jgi:hypothetical protein